MFACLLGRGERDIEGRKTGKRLTEDSGLLDVPDGKAITEKMLPLAMHSKLDGQLPLWKRVGLHKGKRNKNG